MKLMTYYVALAMLGSTATALICIAIETYLAPWLGLPLFLTAFFLILWGAWAWAVKLTEPKPASAPIIGATSDQPA